ncbi:MAG: RDD family protein [Acidimicrobiaceae bacterium]|nr:RDD family protein [Acidimicrobiaceae bacterium]
MSPVNESESEVQLAGWWRRVGATFADDLILLIPSLIIADLFRSFAGGFVSIIAGLAMEGFYMVALLSSASGQTIGNRVAATRVRDSLTGSVISRQQAIKRWGFIALYGLLVPVGGPIMYVALLVAIVDIVYPLMNPRKQTLHDLYARTIVVKI